MYGRPGVAAYAIPIITAPFGRFPAINSEIQRCYIGGLEQSCSRTAPLLRFFGSRSFLCCFFRGGVRVRREEHGETVISRPKRGEHNSGDQEDFHPGSRYQEKLS